MAQKHSFKIPEPRGLSAKVPKELNERRLMSKRPTDGNQLAPTPDAPVRAHYRMAGGK